MKHLFLFVLLITLVNQGFGQEEQGLFDQLQENVWYLPTADEQANLYMTSIGVGDTIIALNGGPGNNLNYLVDAVRGNSSQNTFIFFDQRGSILSPVQDSLMHDLTIDLLVEDLETIRQALKLEKMTLFGHSFGSLLAMFYYMKYPENVEKLILTATMSPYVTKDKPFGETVKEIHQRVKALRTRPEVAAILEEEGLSKENVLSPKERSDRFKITGYASYNMYDLSNWRDFKGGGVYYNPAVDGAIGKSIPETYDIRPTLEENPAPITVIQGDQDYIDPSADYWETIFLNFNQVKLEIVKNSSHYIWLDEQEIFDLHMKNAIDRRN